MSLLSLLAAQLPVSSVQRYGPLGVLLAIVLFFALATLLGTHAVDRLIRTVRHGPIKALPYESGMNPLGTARRRFHVRFYIVAITFLVFDVEIVFLYPWATTLPHLWTDPPLALLSLGRILFFVLTSILAFAYAWAQNAFHYD